jgi:4-amino-4-deoxy-L-arabinose transferase-like glycosyltransferase
MLTRDQAGLKALRPVRLFLGILALGCPWYLRMMTEHPETVSFFFGRELAGRVIGHVDGRRGPIYYHLLLIFVLWLPWLTTLAVVLAANRRHWPPAQGRPRLAALGVEGWLVLTGLVVFTLISSKLPSYTLPLAPWAALALARALLWTRDHVSLRLFRSLAWGCPTGTALVVLTSFLATLVSPRLESSLGSSSSLRWVAQRLRAAGAESVYLDRYWPGMEFYFGERVRYISGRNFQQRANDSGLCPGLGATHFLAEKDWPQVLERDSATNVWVVHYARRKNTPFLEAETPPPLTPRQELGSFSFWRIR